MSTSAKKIDPLSQVPAGTSARPVTRRVVGQLKLVKVPQKKLSTQISVGAGFLIVLLASLVTLALNAGMANATYQARESQARYAQEAERSDNLRSALESRTSPSSLSQAASALGMIQSNDSGYISLTNQEIILPVAGAQQKGN